MPLKCIDIRFFSCAIVIIDANGVVSTSMHLEVGVDSKAELVYKNLLK
jgi:hypothetical protein